MWSLFFMYIINNKLLWKWLNNQIMLCMYRFNLSSYKYNITRTKTSIRYAKENDREKRERKKGRRRDIEREGEIRERERERRKRERRLMLSPNYVTRALKKGGDAHGSLFERTILLKSPELGNIAQRKVKLWAEITRKNYYRKLWVEIIREIYHQVYQWRRKVDTGVSKNTVDQ